MGDSFIWFDIYVGVLQWSGFIFTACIFALMCFTQAANLYERIQQECDLERSLDTPQKETQEKMEGNTTYCYPQDEGPLTRICPECGALYPSYKVICPDDKQILQPFKKPITEPLPTLTVSLTATDETAMKLNSLIQQINDTEEQFESELEKVREELEDRAYEFGNRKRPYTFTDEEALRIYNLYNRVRMKAS